MTAPIVAQLPIDADAARALATHWIARRVGHGPASQGDTMNGERILQIADLSPEGCDDAIQCLADSALTLGFCGGFESGFAFAVAMLANPLQGGDGAVDAAVNTAREFVTWMRKSLDEDVRTMQRQVA